jgi:hypothetical protein
MASRLVLRPRGAVPVLSAGYAGDCAVEVAV